MEQIFVSSVQREFAEERRAIRDFVEGDALLRRFFSVFLFEDLPAGDRRVDRVYLEEVDRSGLYVGLFGTEYGSENEEGVSPTEREFEHATAGRKTRLAFAKGSADADRHPKMRALIGRAGAQVIRRRFGHGTEVSKPIPSYQVYKGTVFQLVDQAVDFVMSKINLAVGTREKSTQAPVAYEMPLEVVREAVVNAVAHRDYTSNGSVQVMLFGDRLEVWNPGTLPPSLTLEMLRQPHGSVPANPLLAESLYLAQYIERMGTGTGDMIARCREAGLSEPQFALTDGFVFSLQRRLGRGIEAVTPPVTPPVAALLRLLGEAGELGNAEIREQMNLKDRTHVREHYVDPALADGLIEPTIPGRPTSRLQKYRLTDKGRALLAAIPKRGDA